LITVRDDRSPESEPTANMPKDEGDRERSAGDSIALGGLVEQDDTMPPSKVAPFSRILPSLLLFPCLPVPSRGEGPRIPISIHPIDLSTFQIYL
jgi:hypothetical protein